MSARDQSHYGNRYANIVGFVHAVGRASIPEIMEFTGLPQTILSQYLTRAVRAGHLYRPERGVYESSDTGPSGHVHEGICDACGRPMSEYLRQAIKASKEEA